jgi:agmatinase
MQSTGRRTVLPDARRIPRFAGVPTFCRFPMIDVVPPESRPVDWAVYGAPFDGGVTYRPGARFGPRAVREASQYMKPYHLEHGVDVAAELSLADAGDSPLRPYSCKETLDAVAGFAEAIGDPGHTRLLAVGGDHSIAYANIAATWKRRGRPEGGLAVVHLDAHLDTVDAVWSERWGHASPFRRAIEDGLVSPRHMISVGVRGPLNGRDDLESAEALGIQVVTARDWREGDGAPCLAEFRRRVEGRELYLSFDIDCVDPAFAPGTGTPCCGGFRSDEVFCLLRSLAGIDLAGADVVEVLPDRDQAGITSLLAAHVVLEMLALAAIRAKAVKRGRQERES